MTSLIHLEFLRSILLLMILPTLCIGAESSSNTPFSPSSNNKILLLDVDNTLYRGQGIEDQIVHSIHQYCANVHNMTKQQADDLHRQYGSTIEGFRQTIWKRASDKELVRHMQDFYQQVYTDIDVSNLLKIATTSSSTGYSQEVVQQQSVLRRLFRALPCNIHLASNSPTFHIQKIVQALGMARIPWTSYWTPNSCQQQFMYPTKQNPKVFFQTLLLEQPDIVLIDDSPTILEAVQKHMQGILVDSNQSLLSAIATAMGWLQSDYTFSDVDYLRAKNAVDLQSINPVVWQQFGQELQTKVQNELCLVDVGAGLLSMLRLVLHGHGSDLPALLPRLSSVSKVEYYAYEPNKNLQRACLEEMERMGFVLKETYQWESDEAKGNHDPEFVFTNQPTDGQPPITVYLRFWGYERHLKRPQPTPHAILGCCFADLMDPNALTQSLMRRFLVTTPDDSFAETLVYFPITFCGITQFVPPQPFEQKPDGSIPSDTVAFGLYSRALREIRGHNLDPNKLIDAMTDHGASSLCRGKSIWRIDPEQHEYLWQTMLYFFGTVAAPELQCAGWDAHGWLARARRNKPSILVSNEDLLFSLPHLGQWQLRAKVNERAEAVSCTFQEIQFIAPHKVTTIRKKAPKLGPTELLIRSVCSLISSGTELKIYKGMFDDAALDVNIESMAEERMAYPLAYGYSLVGRVVECGSEVELADGLLGKLVFTFSAHASQVVVDQSAVQRVPDGIDALDAIFMPSVETALSIVHDAHPMFGEKVAVFGQGLIGLLVTAILSRQGMDVESTSGRLVTLSTFDTLPERLAASAYMGSGQALLPSEAVLAGPFDVAIEVSGNGRALQSAIDCILDCGRIVIGSWYGNADVKLKLGIDFHRSHKTLVTSQVSELPAILTGTWSKERRFALTWELVRQIRPSRLLTKRTNLDEAQDAYSALDEGTEIAVAFEYGKP